MPNRCSKPCQYADETTIEKLSCSAGGRTAQGHIYATGVAVAFISTAK